MQNPASGGSVCPIINQQGPEIPKKSRIKKLTTQVAESDGCAETIMFIHRIAFSAILIISLTMSVAAANETRACYYLSIDDQYHVVPVIFTRVTIFHIVAQRLREFGIDGSQLDEQNIQSKLGAIRLDKHGLFQGDKQLCQWLTNNESRPKEEESTFYEEGFGPILNQGCEKPFSHEITGKWHLTICGKVLNGHLYVSKGGEEYSIPLESLDKWQWVRFTPGEFVEEDDDC